MASGKATTLTKEKIENTIGKEYTYLPEEVISRGKHYDIPEYRIKFYNRENFPMTLFHVHFETLGIDSDYIQYVEIVARETDSKDGNIYTSPGCLSGMKFYVKDKDTLLMDRKGIVFELKKSASYYIKTVILKGKYEFMKKFIIIDNK